MNNMEDRRRKIKDRRPKTERLQTLAVVSLLCLLSFVFLLLPGCKSRTAEPTAQSAAKPVYYCPMHPNYTSDRPGHCPICNMQLVLREETPQASPPAESVPAIPGQAPVQVSDQGAQRIGVRVAPVEVRELYTAIRSPGKVAYDPGLYSAVLEHREAVANFERSQESGRQDWIAQAQDTLRASALRLRQLGLSEREIAKSVKDEYNAERFLLTKKHDKVWVAAQVYEQDLAGVKEGQPVDVTVPSLSGQLFAGRVRSVSPVLNPETRSAQVLIDVSDHENALKPEMYVDAAIKVAQGRQLAVPQEAIMDTGTRRLVFVETAPGRYEPREVRVGPRAEGFRPVLSGLKEGDKVVVSGNFLIDSESKIKAAQSGASSGNPHSH